MELDSRKLHRSALAARALGIVIIAVAVLVLIGWAMNNEALKSVTVHGVAMKTNTAVGLLLAGTSLLLLLSRQISRGRRIVGMTLAAGVLAIAVLTFIQRPLGVDLRIDQLLFTEAPGAMYTTSPNRMGTPALVSFALAGMALLLTDYRLKSGRSPMQFCAVVILVVVTLPLLGYLTGARELYSIARLTAIAPHTAVALAMLAFALLAARADAPPVRLFFLDNAGGEMARRLLPAALLAPILLSSLRIFGMVRG